MRWEFGYNQRYGKNQWKINLFYAVCIGLVGLVIAVGGSFIIKKDYPEEQTGQGSTMEKKEPETGLGEKIQRVRDIAEAKNTSQQLLASGSYTEALEFVLALDTADLKTEDQKELADILSGAADGQYAQFEENTGRLQNAGDYDGALAAVDEEVRLYDRIVAYPLAQQYLHIQWPLTEKRAAIMRSHVSYLLDMGQSEAVYQWDETELNNNILDRLRGYVGEGLMTKEQYDTQRAIIYGKFVNGKIVSMGDQGTDVDSILKFIVRKIGDTGYNCQVIEYWDFYMSVIGKGAGDPALVSARSADGYLLKGSNSRKLISEDYIGLSRDELRLAIYEIYARYGYQFQDPAVNKYFKNYAWYQVDSSYNGDTLNEYERSNLAMLVNYMFNKYQ